MEGETEGNEKKEGLLNGVDDRTIQIVHIFTEIKENNLILTKCGVIRNLVVMGLSFMFLFSSFGSFANLQSTLNKEEGLGTTGQAVLYAVMVLSSLLLTPVTMSKVTLKWIMVISMISYLIFVATGFYPSWYTIMPASVVIGTGAAHLWSAAQIYITDLAKHYAFLTGTEVQDRLSLFLGIFYAFMYISFVWGNLISSFVFQKEDTNKTLHVNEEICGPNFCPLLGFNSTHIINPPKTQIYIYTGACCGLSILAILLMAFFISDIKSQKTSGSVRKLVQQVGRLLCTSRSQHLLIFPTLCCGLTEGFLSSDFTQAYVGCSYGVKNIGFAMIAFGLHQSAGSIVFGKLNQYTGHLAIYIFGCMVQTGLFVTMLHWTPISSEQYVIYIMAAMFGIGGSINTLTVSALYNLYFSKNKSVAISSYRMLNSVGLAISFGYSNWLCSRYKLYILLTIVGLSCISLTVQHIRYSRKLRDKEQSL